GIEFEVGYFIRRYLIRGYIPYVGSSQMAPSPDPTRSDEAGEATLTVEQLAYETGMSVRNIRNHQSRGLLPPPEVRARTGYYGPEHVARLRLIQELQGNGYNLAAIKDLVERTSGSSQDALDFARAILTPFEDERPE